MEYNVDKVVDELEELKEYKQKPDGWMWDEAERNGYNTAIDDFANVLKENYDYLPQILSQEAFGLYIDEYAEQLKVGGENE